MKKFARKTIPLFLLIFTICSSSAYAIDSTDAQLMREAVEKARSGTLSIFVINPQTRTLKTAPFEYGHDKLASDWGGKSKVVAGVIMIKDGKPFIGVTVPPADPAEGAKWGRLETFETYLKDLSVMDPALETALQDCPIQVKGKGKIYGSSASREGPVRKVSPLQEGILKTLQESGEITDKEARLALKNLEEGRPLEGKLQAKVDKIRGEVSEIYQQNPITDPEGNPDWKELLREWKLAKKTEGKKPGGKGNIYEALKSLSERSGVTEQDVKELCELVKKETGDENVLEQLKKLKREAVADGEGKKGWAKEISGAENEVMSVIREALKSTTKNAARLRAQNHSLGGVVSVAHSGKWGIKPKEQLTFDTDFDVSFFADMLPDTDPHSGIIADIKAKISEAFSTTPEHLGIVITGLGYEAGADVYVSSGGKKWAAKESMTEIYFIDPATGEFSKNFSQDPERLFTVLQEKILWRTHPELFTGKGKLKPGITAAQIRRVLRTDPDISDAYKVFIEGSKFTKEDAATAAIDMSCHVTETIDATTPEEAVAKIAKQAARSSDVFMEGMKGSGWKKHLKPEDIALMEQCRKLDTAKIDEAKAHTELIMKLEGAGDPADWTPDEARALDSLIDKVKGARKETKAAIESIGASKTDLQQVEFRKRAVELMRKQGEAAHFELIADILKLSPAERSRTLLEYQKELRNLQEHYSKKKDVPQEILEWAGTAEKSATSLIEIEMIETGKVPKVIDSVEKLQRAKKEPVERVDKILNQSETGKKIIEKTERYIESARRATVPGDQPGFSHPLSEFVGEFYKQHELKDAKAVVAWAGTLAMAASMVETAMTAKDDTELALGIGHSVVQFWPPFMIAENLGLSVMEGDNIKLAKAIMMILLPETALPDMIQAIGNVAVNIAAALSFDTQLDALYYVSEFKDGKLVMVDDYAETIGKKRLPTAEDFKNKGKNIPPIDIEEQPQGSEGLETFFFYAFVEQGGHKLLLDMIAKAVKNSSTALADEAKGVNFFMKAGVRETIRSTVIKGNQLIFKEDGPLQAACANIRKYDQEISDFTSAFNIKIDSTAKPADFGNDMNNPRAPGWAPDLDQGQVRALSQLVFDREKWRIIAKEAFLEALVRTLEIRDRAEKDVNAQKHGELYEKLTDLFRDLDILEVGIASFQYKSGYNIATRVWNETLQFKTRHERDVHEMKVLQAFLDAYSSVKQTRDAIENTFRSNAGKEPGPRPLTSSLPLTGEPEKDMALAQEFAQEISRSAKDIRKELEWIKKAALDKDGYDRQMYYSIYEASYLRAFFDIQCKAARHMAKSSWFWQLMKKYDAEAAYFESNAKREEYKKLYAGLIEDFKKHYEEKEKEKAKEERLEKETKELTQRAKVERELLEKEKAEKEKAEKEKVEKARLQKEKAEKEKTKLEKQAKDVPQPLPSEPVLPPPPSPAEASTGVSAGAAIENSSGELDGDWVTTEGSVYDGSKLHFSHSGDSYTGTLINVTKVWEGGPLQGLGNGDVVLRLNRVSTHIYKGQQRTNWDENTSWEDTYIAVIGNELEYNGSYGEEELDGAAVTLGKRVSSIPASSWQPQVNVKAPEVVLTPSAIAPLRLGEKVNIRASVLNAGPDDKPVRYVWSGDGKSSGDTTSIIAKTPGNFKVSVSASGPHRTLGSATLEYVVGMIAVHVEKTSPAGNAVSVGEKAQFKAIAMSATGELIQGLNFRWQPHPEVEFEPFEKSATTTATFRRPGAYRIYAQALIKDGDSYVTAGESEEVAITVSNSSWNLSFKPQEPLVGQDAKARISPDMEKNAAEIDMKEMNFRWQVPANARQTGTSEDDREITFYLTDNKSASISCLASTKYNNENLGGAGRTITAKNYDLSISGPSPRQEFQEWRGGTQLGEGPSAGMKKVENRFIVDQEIFFASKITPVPPKPVSYNWTVSSESCTFRSNGGTSTSMTCGSAGGYTATATAKMDGMEIGSATARVSVSAPEGGVAGSRTAEADKSKKEKAQRLVNEGYADEKKGNIGEALKKYKAALAIVPDPKLTEHIAALEKKMAEERKGK